MWSKPGRSTWQCCNGYKFLQFLYDRLLAGTAFTSGTWSWSRSAISAAPSTLQGRQNFWGCLSHHARTRAWKCSMGLSWSNLLSHPKSLCLASVSNHDFPTTWRANSQKRSKGSAEHSLQADQLWSESEIHAQCFRWKSLLASAQRSHGQQAEVLIPARWVTRMLSRSKTPPLRPWCQRALVQWGKYNKNLKKWAVNSARLDNPERALGIFSFSRSAMEVCHRSKA